MAQCTHKVELWSDVQPPAAAWEGLLRLRVKLEQNGGWAREAGGGV